MAVYGTYDLTCAHHKSHLFLDFTHKAKNADSPCLLVWLAGWLAGYLVVGWLVGWLVGWFISLMLLSLFLFFSSVIIWN